MSTLLSRSALVSDSVHQSTRVSAVAVAGIASLGAGVIHGGAIGMHSDHPQLARMFILVTVAQVVWGLVAMVNPSRWALPIGVVINGGAVGAWLATRLTGIGWIAGLETRESPQWADSIAAGLGVLAAALAVAAYLVGPSALPHIRLLPPSTLVSALAVFALWNGVSHVHAHGHDGPVIDASKFEDTGASVIDLSGFPGVSAEEQQRAEFLIFDTRETLPKFASTQTAIDVGFTSIHDEATGIEHYINWSYINDDHVLDPNYPESLVYEVGPGGTRTLVSAMYMLGDGYTLETVPNIGGPLTQWHIHDNLCFDRDPLVDGSTRVIGVTSSNGPCLVGMKLAPHPMLHVWLEPQVCGPFAALEGIGAGQIKPGEERLCDSLHSHT